MAGEALPLLKRLIDRQRRPSAEALEATQIMDIGTKDPTLGNNALANASPGARALIIKKFGDATGNFKFQTEGEVARLKANLDRELNKKLAGQQAGLLKSNAIAQEIPQLRRDQIQAGVPPEAIQKAEDFIQSSALANPTNLRKAEIIKETGIPLGEGGLSKQFGPPDSEESRLALEKAQIDIDKATGKIDEPETRGQKSTRQNAERDDAFRVVDREYGRTTEAGGYIADPTRHAERGRANTFIHEFLDDHDPFTAGELAITKASLTGSEADPLENRLRIRRQDLEVERDDDVRASIEAEIKELEANIDAINKAPRTNQFKKIAKKIKSFRDQGMTDRFIAQQLLDKFRVDPRVFGLPHPDRR